MQAQRRGEGATLHASTTWRGGDAPCNQRAMHAHTPQASGIGEADACLRMHACAHAPSLPPLHPPIHHPARPRSACTTKCLAESQASPSSQAEPPTP
eukprot:224424-Chlamydomonas_euryale.AAC.2